METFTRPNKNYYFLNPVIKRMEKIDWMSFALEQKST